MRNAITVALALGLAATAASAQQSEMSGARVQVRVYDNGVVPAADQTVALRAAAGVLAAAGIDVSWLLCGVDESAVNPETCDTPLGRTELSVRFVRLAGVPSAHGQLQLGYSLVDTTIGEGKLATVYVDRVHWLAAQAGADTSTVLGFAAAHEIGHLLLGTNAHAPSGLMRAVWSRRELEHAQVSDWLFSREEASSMRSSLAQRNGLRSSQRDATGCPASRRGDADPPAECGGSAFASLRGVVARPDR